MITRRNMIQTVLASTAIVAMGPTIAEAFPAPLETIKMPLYFLADANNKITVKALDNILKYAKKNGWHMYFTSEYAFLEEDFNTCIPRYLEQHRHDPNHVIASNILYPSEPCWWEYHR